MIDVFVRLIPLPSKIKGCVTPNDDDTYDVYINSNLCDTAQKQAVDHELNHIKKKHLYDEIKTITVIENEAG